MLSQRGFSPPDLKTLNGLGVSSVENPMMAERFKGASQGPHP